MAEFKRIKVLATLESDVLLLTYDQIDRVLGEVAGKLKNTGLKIVAIEPEEQAATSAAIPVGYDD